MKVLFVFLLSLPSAATAIRPTLSHQSRAHRTAREAGVRIDVASKEKGLGAFATSKIRVGEYIGTYVGEVMTREEVRARYWGKAKPTANDKSWAKSRRERGQDITGNYVIELSDGRFVDAEDADYSDWCRFMNHATEGTENCNVKAFDRLTTDGELLEFPQFYAIRDIDEGDELNWDYGPLFFLPGGQKQLP